MEILCGEIIERERDGGGVSVVVGFSCWRYFRLDIRRVSGEFVETIFVLVIV